MTNKKSFFEKLTGSIKFNNDDEYNDVDIYDEEYLEDEDQENEKRKLSIDSDNYDDEEYETEEEEIGELSIDMHRINNSIVIRTMVAGIKKTEIDITLTRDLVVIEGTRQPENLGTTKDTYYEELYWGAFERTIELPEEVDIEEAEAHEHHGLLTLVLPLIDKHKQARLKIK
jgi:HSP20 family molecular chaperone IbpA